MDNKYLDLYKKYKTKYLNLQKKGMLGGGYTLKISLGDIDKIFTNQLTFLDLRGNELFLIRSNIEKETEIIKNQVIEEYNKGKLEYSFSWNENKEDFDYFDLESYNPQYIIEGTFIKDKISSKFFLTEDKKLYKISIQKNKCDIIILILTNTGNLEENYADMKEKEDDNLFGKITNKEGKIEYKGNIQITKNTDSTKKSRQTEINIKTTSVEIDGVIHNYDYDINLSSITDIIQEFNFQQEYDKLKKNHFCETSTILYKQIYNSYYIEEYLNNVKLYSFLTKYSNIIMSKILLNKIAIKEEDIKTVCNDEIFRQQLLMNTMKRVNTTFTKGILLKNIENNSVFDLEDLNKTYPTENFKVIFDTGNSTTTLIGEKFVKALGLIPKKTFTHSVVGVSVSAAEKFNEVVELEISFNTTLTNIDIKKSIKIRAYVGSNPTILLLGQGNGVLYELFKNSYCIGYDFDRVKYEEKCEHSMKKIEEYIKVINYIYENLYNAGRYSDIESNIRTKIREGILDKPITMYINCIKTDEYLKKIDTIYSRAKKIKEKITSSSGIREFSDFFGL